MSFWPGLATIFGGLIGLDGAYTYASPFFAAFFPAALVALGVAGLVVLAVLVTRPLVERHPHTEDDWTHAERLVHTYGWDTLAYFALRDDKSFFFAQDGEAFLAYTYVGGYALVAGDPIGRRESVVAVLDEFLDFCAERGWNPALLAAREASMPLYSSRGFSAFYLGDEAIVDCRTFSLGGRKSLRSAVRRVGRRYRFQMIPESQASPRLVEQLNAISARWRGKNPERGFTMSLSQDIVGAGANPEFLLCVALDDGLLALVTAWETPALVLAAVGGTLASQSAFQAGGLGASLPIITVGEPLVGVALGAAVLDEQVRVDGAEWLLFAVLVVAMTVATGALARSAAARQEARSDGASTPPTARGTSSSPSKGTARNPSAPA